MKKSILMFALILFAFIVNAADKMNYVTIEGKTYFSKDVTVGPYNVRFATDDGLTLRAPLKKVDAMMIDNQLWERLPVICCKGKSKGTALMEFVCQRGGLRLYKYHSDDCKLGCIFFDRSKKETMYFLYDKGKLYLRVNENNAPTVFAFFKVPYNGIGNFDETLANK